MNTAPRVSIVIPSYNQAEFVPETVASALAQTYPQVEVIVVDDGSTDETAAALVPYRDRISYICQQNRGLAAARNTGFHAASGQYLLFLDADDLLRPQALQTLAALLDSHPHWGLVYSAWQQISEDGAQILGEVHPREQGQVLEKILLRRFFFFASSALIRRDCLDRAGLFDEALPWSEDADMWLRVALGGWDFGYCDQPLMQYRIRDNSMTGSIQAAQAQGWITALQKFFASPNLPAAIQSLEPQAHSVLHFETAGRYFRVGNVALAQSHLHEAARAHPAVEAEWFLEWVAGTALDPRTRSPQQFINRVFDNLVPELAGMRRLRRQAHSRYHTAAAFAADKSGSYRSVRKHVLPALAGNPLLIQNRGFLRIAARSLVSKES